MYTFRVFVSTLIILMIFVLAYAVLKAEGKAARFTAYVLMGVYILSFIAIWG